MKRDDNPTKTFHSQKPLLFITGALTIAVIVMAVQLVFLTLQVADQKESLHNSSSATDVRSLQTKVTNLNNTLVEYYRELEGVRNNLNRVSAEFHGVQGVVGKTDQDYRFLQQELSNFDNRIAVLERNNENTRYILQSIERTLQSSR
ncbi:MAG: hypothetical protein SOV16_01830 [Anaerobiospirillum succiniciproducens]|uniref:hypothetical protein n=1 Tax=Anaerobiospirillum succiniciproducens TaxID=13335 RepID=UPI002A761543|nr:hypothetical protein [Anaerobiospirillum succiniciproducens]MDY2797909.1 hypothetical protein [Anaerobiospirillum succiniciproducens]